MKAVEFCYWLQGYFELSEEGEPRALTSKQIACVKAHLALVAKVDPAHDNMFVEWLGGYLDMPPDMSRFAKIKRMLASQFQHVVDPSYGGDKEVLQSIHDGSSVFAADGNPKPGVLRCR
jgi:hypothetical protein